MLRYLVLCWLLFATTMAWASKPLADWIATPDSMGLRYKSLTLTTPDHVRLAAWLIAPVASAPDQRTTMVVAGSDWGNMSYSLDQARALAAAGYQVLLFDYRGFGHSEAFAIDQHQLYYPEFAIDLGAALAEARRRSPRQRVGIIGFSMGTILGAKVAATTRCDFLITDSYFANPQAVVAHYQKVRPERPVTLPADAATYVGVAPRVDCPWLFIAGTEDQATPLADSLATARAAHHGQRREVLAVPCGHLGAIVKLTKQTFGDGYVQAVSRFLAGKSATAKG
ncbi:alpha/beta hydrolase [Hymenobacter bucti]|uniref:Alpha/beta hydrolase n=1 Tax=Hymenobacter bucti TaxID=1844114 RepID=A0ABW4QRV4_9BACT